MQTQSKFLRHAPCEACGSSDSKAEYADGTGFCFNINCRTFFKASDGSASAQNRVIPMEDYKASQEAKKGRFWADFIDT